VGLGPKRGITAEALTAAAARAARSAIGAGAGSVAVGLLPGVEMRPDTFLSAVGGGFLEGSAGGHIHVSILAPDAESYERLSNILKTMQTTKGRSA